METGRRAQRVEKEIKHLVSTYFLREGRGRYPGVVSIAEVSVSGDLRQAKIYLSFLGREEDREEFVDALEDLRPEAQHQVAKQLTMKFSPKLKFFVSQGTEFVTR